MPPKVIPAVRVPGSGLRPVPNVLGWSGNQQPTQPLSAPPAVLAELKLRMSEAGGTNQKECIFGRNCLRVDCLDSHTQGRDIEDHPEKVICHFGRKCLHRSCFYVHPGGRELDDNPQLGMCWRGDACNDPNCVLEHPDARKRKGSGPNGVPQERRCFTCGETGHESSACPRRGISRVQLSGFARRPGETRDDLQLRLTTELEAFGQLAYALKISESGVTATAIFLDFNSANRAVELLKGQPFRAKLDCDSKEYDKSFSVAFGNISFDCKEAELIELFNTTALVRAVRIVRDKGNLQSRGYGFCDFYDAASAKTAVEVLDDTDFQGRRLRVAAANDETDQVSGTYAEISDFPGSWSPKSQDEIRKQITTELYMFGPFESEPEIIDSGNKAIVCFKELSMAQQAIRLLNGLLFNIKLCGENFRKNNRNAARIHVGRLPDETTEEELRDTFSRIGIVVYAKIIYHNDTGQSKGFGFLEFYEVADAVKACDGTHKFELNGRTLTVDLAVDRFGEDGKLRPRELYKVFVGNISDDTTEAQLKELFTECGRVRFATIMADPSGVRQKFGFVEYEEASGVQRAIQELDTMMLNGKSLRVQNANDKKSDKKAKELHLNRIFVGGLSDETSSEDVHEIFKGIGNITHAKVVYFDKEHTRSKNIAFVEFEDFSSVERAIKEMDGFEVNGKHLRVQVASDKNEKSEKKDRNPFNVAFVGGLSDDTTEEDLRDTFQGMGRIVRATISYKLGKPRGIGFIEFEDESCVRRAIDELDGVELKGRILNVAVNREARERRGSHRIFVAGLTDAITDEQLRSTFEGIGYVVDIHIPIDKETQRNKGFGFVEFTSESSVKSAVEEMDGMELNGKRLSVEAYKERGEERDRSRSPRGKEDTDKNEGRSAKKGNLQVVIHVDELAMPDRPVVTPTSVDCEVWVDPLSKGDVGHKWLDEFGTVEEIFQTFDPETGERTDRGYVRYANHESAARCVDAGDAVWSESERIINSGKSMGKPSVYTRSVVSKILGPQGKFLTALREKIGASRLMLRGKGLNEPPAGQWLSDRLHFVCKGSASMLADLQPALEENLSRIHCEIKETCLAAPKREAPPHRDRSRSRGRGRDRKRKKDQRREPPFHYEGPQFPPGVYPGPGHPHFGYYGPAPGGYGPPPHSGYGPPPPGYGPPPPPPPGQWGGVPPGFDMPPGYWGGMPEPGGALPPPPPPSADWKCPLCGFKNKVNKNGFANITCGGEGPLGCKAPYGSTPPPGMPSDKWSCPSCGFKNVPHNTVCGGNGRLGCKAPYRGDYSGSREPDRPGDYYGSREPDRHGHAPQRQPPEEYARYHGHPPGMPPPPPPAPNDKPKPSARPSSAPKRQLFKGAYESPPAVGQDEDGYASPWSDKDGWDSPWEQQEERQDEDGYDSWDDEIPSWEGPSKSAPSAPERRSSFIRTPHSR